MKVFSFAAALAMLVAFLSCSNAPVQETVMINPPSMDISSGEVELFCKDMTYEESIDCVASLKDKKREDWEKWKNSKGSGD